MKNPRFAIIFDILEMVQDANTNSNSYMIYEIVSLSTTLSDLKVLGM